MTSEMSEDVVLQIASPQIMPPEGGVGGGSAAVARGGGALSGSVELGRRLLLAARLGQTQLVLELMAKGAPFTTDWLGTSPLHLAASSAHADTCAVLLRAGVSRDSRTKVERTPLHLAAHAGHAAVAELLLENGALVDCRDMLRMTPLHWAAERGHAAAAAALLRHGADPCALSKFNKTPYSLARARNRTDILKLIEDTLKEREAAKSVDALRVANEQITEIPASEQQRALESIERLHETVKPSNRHQVHTEPFKIEIERPPVGRGAASDALAAQLLRKHGITLLPHDDSSTVLNAIQSGRTVVLSDAGKLMLKESSPPAPAPAPAPAAAPVSMSKGVILTAAPVKSPPKPGVKIFTLNNKLLAMPKENNVPIKKIVNPQDMQIKFVTLPADTKIISPGKVSMKAKQRLRAAAGGAPPAGPGGGPGGAAGGAPPAGPGGGPGGGAGGRRPAVKIIMHKANFNKMMAEKGHVIENGMETTTITPPAELTKVLHGSPGATGSGAPAGAPAPAPVCVPPEFLSSNSTQYLRAQLLAAHRALHELRQEASALRQEAAALRERLARADT